MADNGRGLPLDFNPDQAASLGLPLVQRLAEQLGGRGHLLGGERVAEVHVEGQHHVVGPTG